MKIDRENAVIPCFKRSRLERGFSLIELLIVMAVVAILAALLSSALNSARSRGNQIACLNHLRQLQTAWIMYSHENQEELPLNRTQPSNNSRLLGRKNAAGSWVVGNPKEDRTDENIRLGTLFPYVQATGIYRCPQDSSPVLTDKSLTRTRSYSISEFMNGDQAGANPLVKKRLDELQSPSPAQTFVFTEEYEHSAWHGSFAVDLRPDLQTGVHWASVPAAWHQGSGNLSFADGHIENWRWRWPNQRQRMGAVGGPAITNASSEDSARLKERSPRR